MKKIFLLFFVSLSTLLIAQPVSPYDCVEGAAEIRTHPSEAYNPYCNGQFVNTFDWTQEYWPIDEHIHYLPVDSVLSPFFDANNSYHEDFSDDPFWRDFNPEDGWELLQRRMSSATMHFIFYNRYTSTIRVFGWMYQLRDFRSLNFFAGFLRSYLPISAIYGRAGATFQTLDQRSIPRIHSSIPWIGDRPHLYLVDIPVAYDPCSCANELNWLLFGTAEAYSQYLHFVDKNGRYDQRISGRSENSSSRAVSDSAGNGLAENYRAVVMDNTGFHTGKMNYGINQQALLQFSTEQGMNRFWRDWAERAPHTAVQRSVYQAFEEALLSADSNATSSLRGLQMQLDSSQWPDEVRQALQAHPSLGSTPLGLLQYFAAHSKHFNMPIIRGAGFSPGETRLKGAREWSPLTGQLRGFLQEGTYRVYPILTTAMPGSPFNTLYCAPNLNPYYDRPLGRWAILEQPTVDCQTYQVDSIVATTEPCQQEGFQRNSYRFQYTGDMRFRFNPAADIDQERTSIYAALQVETPRLDGFFSNSNCPDHRLPYFDSEDFFLVDSTANSLIWQSRLMPLACLSDYQAELDLIRPQPFYNAQATFIDTLMNDVQVELQLVVNFVFDDYNSKGERAQALQVYNIATKGQVTEIAVPDRLERYPNRIQLDSAFFTQDTVLFAWDAIALNDNVELAPGISVRLRAPNVLLPAGFTPPSGLQIEQAPAPQNCQPVEEVSTSEMFMFCYSDKYRADEHISPLRSEAPQAPGELEVSLLSANVFPNPASAQLSVRYELAQPAFVNMQIVDLLGRSSTIFQGEQLPGEQQQIIDVSDRGVGLYYLRLEVGPSQRVIPFQVIR